MRDGDSYIRDGDSDILVGSDGGAQKEPMWLGNLESMSEATIEVGEETLTVRPTTIRGRTAEREELYARLVAYWPDFSKYEENTVFRARHGVAADPVTDPCRESVRGPRRERDQPGLVVPGEAGWP